VDTSLRLGDAFDSILDAARAGADWAWERIYDSLSPTLLGYLRARGAPDPENVMGEVLAQLVRDIGRFRGDEAGFRSWVFVMAHHRLLDDLRRRRRRPESPASHESMAEIEDVRTVEADVVEAATRRELRSLLDQLTPAQRDVVLLRVFGGLKIEEVARALGRRTGAVKALQRRAFETLKVLLEQREYPSGVDGR
jgi:RNA polymerase sigma-70 factor (ECF subfamily)